MNVRRHSRAWLCCLAAVAACGTQTARAPAGRWRADSTPITDIPGTGPSGEILLERPVAATRLASGEIVVADGGAQSVLFFDAHGRLVRRAGREGGGPGEYRHVMWLGNCGNDSLVVWDPGRSRIVVLDSAGTVVRHSAVPMLWAVTCNRAGRLALVGWPTGGSTAMVRGTPYLSVGLSIVPPTGVDTGPAVHIPLLEAGLSPPAMPLAPAATVALTAERIYVGTPDTSAVSAYTLTGQLEATVPVHTRRRRATDHQFEAAIEAFVDANAPPDWHASLRQQVEARVQKPEWLPFYGPLFADSLGRVWAQTSFPGDSETVLAAVGDLASRPAEIVVPRFLTVYEVGTDYVLGAYSDADGEPHVALYVFRSPGS